MDCPKCNKRMLAVTYRSLQIDRCPECQGVWLDRSELDSLLEKKLAGLLDAGAFTPATPEQDALPARCHRCDADMVALTGAADVRFEWCERCEGLFFDKGELTVLEEFEAD